MNGTVFYLALNAVMYAVFALWCTVKPRTTAHYLGFDLRNWHGVSEYTAVYGGLEAGLAVFYGVAVFQPRLQEPALLFSLCLYSGIALFRTYVLLRSGFAIGHASYFLMVEIVLAVAGGWLWSQARSV